MNFRQEQSLKLKNEYEGKHFYASDGHEFIIVEFNSTKNVIIQFIGSDYKTNTQLQHIVHGRVKYPFAKSCIAFENNEYRYNNSIFKTNQGYFVRVLEYKGISEIIIQFLDTGYICTVTAQNLEKGEVRNPFHKNQFGGYLGIGPYTGNDYKWLYRIWYNMLIRGDDSDYYNKYHGTNTITYGNVIVHEDWKNYSNFSIWYMNMYNSLSPRNDYDIDKDLLSKYYNLPRMYSPQTCILIPHSLNTLIETGRVSKRSFNNYNNPFHIYKAKKEKEVREMAEQYYRAGALPEIAYKILSKYSLNYEDLDD